MNGWSCILQQKPVEGQNNPPAHVVEVVEPSASGTLRQGARPKHPQKSGKKSKSKTSKEEAKSAMLRNVANLVECLEDLITFAGCLGFNSRDVETARIYHYGDTQDAGWYLIDWWWHKESAKKDQERKRVSKCCCVCNNTQQRKTHAHTRTHTSIQCVLRFLQSRSFISPLQFMNAF